MQKPSICFLIDNDEEDQEIFSMALQEIDAGISCICANDGVAAIKHLIENENFIPSFIFIDMNMPMMNGKQCLQEIKKIDRLKPIPLYIYSTTADPASIAHVKEMGATDFIIKPSSYKALIESLSALIQNVP